MELKQETINKNKLIENVFDGKVPERVPVLVSGC